MSDEILRIQELEKKVNDLTVQVQGALNQLRTDTVKVSSRLEAMIRRSLFEKNISMEDFLLTLETYSEFREAIIEINKIESIPEKIEAAVLYNKAAHFYHFPIYADDLNLKPLFEKMGGPSSEIAFRMVSALPISSSYQEYLYKYVKT